VERIQSLYDQGLFLTAWREGRSLGPIRNWPDAILAGRLAGQLGHPGLRAWLHLRNYRSQANPSPEDTLFYLFAVDSTRGPLAAWEELRRLGPGLPRATARQQADWYAMHAETLASLRDFSRAERWQRRAEALAGSEPWIRCVRADLFHRQGDYAAAVEVLEAILVERPNYAPACQRMGDFRQALGQDDEAEAFLIGADRRLECCWLAYELVVLLADLGRMAEVEPWCARCAELAPLRPAPMRRWLRRHRGEAAYAAGDRPRALACFRKLSPFHTRLVERLEKNGSTARVELKVPFVRQRHMTCAPASIASLTAYWGRPVDHEELTRAICYDGTPEYRERGWLEEQGWRTREFRVTWESARTLLDRGIPFILTTVGAGSAHAQAVVGYDEARRSLTLCDPTLRLGEMLEEGLEDQAAWGPRGVVFVPPEAPELPELPDQELYDRLYEVLRALPEHRRDDALQALQSLPEEHSLTLIAQGRLALYDGDLATLLALTRVRAERFPKDEGLAFNLLGLLQNQACPSEYLALLERQAHERGADRTLGLMLGRQLVRDGRHHWRARRWLRRSRAASASACTGLAELAWVAQEAGEAVELSRLASCLEEHDEHRAWTYYERAAGAGREDEALDYLRERCARFGDLSGDPAITLFEALARGGRSVEAFERLEEARRRRPEDAELVLAEARARVRFGQPERGRALLEEARGRVGAGAWLTAAAQLEEQEGNLRRALELWRERVRTETSDPDAHAEIARLTDLVEGPEAAVAHLRQAVARHPHHVGLRTNLVSRLRYLGQGEPEVRELLALSPSNAWAWRALALLLARRGEHKEAATAFREAVALEPGSPAQWEVRGVLAQLAGEREEARRACREYLQLSADNPNVLRRLLECGGDPRQELAFSLEWAERRPTGPLITAWRELAESYLPRAEVIKGLLRIRAAAPDCPESWTALMRGYDLAGQSEDRDRTAAEAAERFPWNAELHQELGQMHTAARRFDEACASLARAVELNRGSPAVRRMLSEAHRQAGRLAEARNVLEEALAMAPHEPYVLADLAEVLWEFEEEKDEAVELLVRALQLEPQNGYGWDLLLSWRQDRALEVAREAVERRPGEADLWVRLAEMSPLEEALGHLERALKIAPALESAHDQRIQILARAGRVEEALASLRAPVWQGQPPCSLRGREAWLRAHTGDYAGAISLMQRVVEDEPHYRWGWLHLLDWLDNHGPPAAYRATSERFLELHPNDPQGWVGRGDARLRLKDRGGLADLRRALELDGRQLWAAATLLEAAFEDNDLKQVDGILDLVKDEAVLNWFKVRLASRLRLPDELRAELVRLAALNPGGLEEMVQLLGREGWTWSDLGPALEQGLLEHPGYEVAKAWVQSLSNRWDESKVVALPDAAFAFAGPVFLERLSGVQDLRALVKRQRDRLRSVTRVWAQVGAGFVNFGAFSEAIEWLGDYAAREDLEAYMVANLVLALHLSGKPERALEVGAWASARGHEDEMMLAVLALEDALGGRLEQARAWLERIPADRSPYSEVLKLLTEAVLAGDWDKVVAARGVMSPELTVAVRRRVMKVLARRGGWLRAAWEWWW